MLAETSELYIYLEREARTSVEKSKANMAEIDFQIL
jgi:hypothetical protein